MTDRPRKPTHLADPDTPGHLKQAFEIETYKHIPRTPNEIKMAKLDGERLPVPGHPEVKGMKVTEVVKLSRIWWDRVGRFAMPDFAKAESERVVGSPILNGETFDQLDKISSLRVVKMWYAHYGIPAIVGGKLPT